MSNKPRGPDRVLAKPVPDKPHESRGVKRPLSSLDGPSLHRMPAGQGACPQPNEGGNERGGNRALTTKQYKRPSTLRSNEPPGGGQERVEEQPRGLVEITAACAVKADRAPRTGEILVLTTERPPRSQPVGWLSNNGSSNGADLQDLGEEASTQHVKNIQVSVACGIVRSAMVISKGSWEVKIALYPKCPSHANMEDPPCGKVVKELRDKQSAWWAINCGGLVTQTREQTALHKLPDLKVLEYILQPRLLAERGERLLKPEFIQRLWPTEVAVPKFINFLKGQYDYTQLYAIEVAASFLGVRGTQQKEDCMPFVLVQGPPGTGKTHTVKGILNVWHLVHYQRYYNSLVAALTSDARKSVLMNHMHDALERRIPNLVAKPKILVCAPSNAAADELLQRIMNEGFSDAEGRVYRPNVVRVGSDTAPLSRRAKDVWVDGMIQRYMDMGERECAESQQRFHAQVKQLSREIYALQATICDMKTPAEADQFSRQLADKHDLRDKALVELNRLEEVQSVLHKSGAADLKQARENLELSFVQEAEMVFTTLSSTGRRIFSRLPNSFETVLIDEAAQASEAAALQALGFGCKRAVLVGDPQQLPATILSARAKEASLERSLFERLQAGGCPVQMLSVQYRMHPGIREFPSKYFYDNQLKDGASVKNAPAEPFYSHPLLKPYVFFDVSRGKHERKGAGGSLGNKAEAEMAACLFMELRSFLIEQTRKGIKVQTTRVGVITFYKQQVEVLRRTFEQIAGPEVAAEVMIETVDSFQGKQLDVIILSCVRAEARASGIGFVNDVRRLNVAITRAKRALWILGSAATLQQSHIWQALINNAQQRQVVIEDAHAGELFPKIMENVHLRQQSGNSHSHLQQLERGLSEPGRPFPDGKVASQPSLGVVSNTIREQQPRLDARPRSQTPPVPVDLSPPPERLGRASVPLPARPQQGPSPPRHPRNIHPSGIPPASQGVNATFPHSATSHPQFQHEPNLQRAPGRAPPQDPRLAAHSEAAQRPFTPTQTLPLSASAAAPVPGSDVDMVVNLSNAVPSALPAGPADPRLRRLVPNTALHSAAHVKQTSPASVPHDPNWGLQAEASVTLQVHTTSRGAEGHNVVVNVPLCGDSGACVPGSAAFLQPAGRERPEDIISTNSSQGASLPDMQVPADNIRSFGQDFKGWNMPTSAPPNMQLAAARHQGMVHSNGGTQSVGQFVHQGEVQTSALSGMQPVSAQECGPGPGAGSLQSMGQNLYRMVRQTSAPPGNQAAPAQVCGPALGAASLQSMGQNSQGNVMATCAPSDMQPVPAQHPGSVPGPDSLQSMGQTFQGNVVPISAPSGMQPVPAQHHGAVPSPGLLQSMDHNSKGNVMPTSAPSVMQPVAAQHHGPVSGAGSLQAISQSFQANVVPMSGPSGMQPAPAQHYGPMLGAGALQSTGQTAQENTVPTPGQSGMQPVPVQHHGQVPPSEHQPGVAHHVLSDPAHSKSSAMCTAKQRDDLPGSYLGTHLHIWQARSEAQPHSFSLGVTIEHPGGSNPSNPHGSLPAPVTLPPPGGHQRHQPAHQAHSDHPRQHQPSLSQPLPQPLGQAVVLQHQPPSLSRAPVARAPAPVTLPPPGDLQHHQAAHQAHPDHAWQHQPALSQPLPQPLGQAIALQHQPPSLSQAPHQVPSQHAMMFQQPQLGSAQHPQQPQLGSSQLLQQLQQPELGFSQQPQLSLHQHHHATVQGPLQHPGASAQQQQGPFLQQGPAPYQSAGSLAHQHAVSQQPQQGFWQEPHTAEALPGLAQPGGMPHQPQHGVLQLQVMPEQQRVLQQAPQGIPSHHQVQHFQVMPQQHQGVIQRPVPGLPSLHQAPRQ
eukprot:jgi/Botrbrau1/17592/Bobra.0166s0033.2